MIAVDTNILVRYFAEDDQVQTRLAQQLFEQRLTSMEPGFVSLVTLVELIWVLTDTYRIERTVLIEIVIQLLAAPNIIVESDGLVRTALEMHGGDISDHIIHLIGRAHGCSKTVTFDKKFARIAGVERLA